MKAAMRDRSECVAALLMAGADLTAVDPVRGKTALEWALLTDSFDTVCRIRQLLRRPQVEQLSQYYQPEWPALPGLPKQVCARAARQCPAPSPSAPAPSGGPRLPGLRPLPEPSGHVEHVPSVATAQGQYQPQAPSSQDPPLQGTLISLAVQAEAPAVRASNAGPSSLEIPGAQDGEEEAGGGGGGQVVTEPGEDGLGWLGAGNRPLAEAPLPSRGPSAFPSFSVNNRWTRLFTRHCSPQ
uniref:Ankyrin repeat domain 33 n=1 Tax=Equus asinus asinus TaxID=83772 RepID=A0A8C4LT03_EQUAS